MERITEGKLKLTEGEHIQRGDIGKAVISEELAAVNRLKIGDIITGTVTDEMIMRARSNVGKTYDFQIVGIFQVDPEADNTSPQRAEAEILSNYVYVDEKSGMDVQRDVWQEKTEYANGHYVSRRLTRHFLQAHWKNCSPFRVITGTAILSIQIMQIMTGRQHSHPDGKDSVSHAGSCNCHGNDNSYDYPDYVESRTNKRDGDFSFYGIFQKKDYGKTRYGKSACVCRKLSACSSRCIFRSAFSWKCAGYFRRCPESGKCDGCRSGWSCFLCCSYRVVFGEDHAGKSKGDFGCIELIKLLANIYKTIHKKLFKTEKKRQYHT